MLLCRHLLRVPRNVPPLYVAQRLLSDHSKPPNSSEKSHLSTPASFNPNITHTSKPSDSLSQLSTEYLLERLLYGLARVPTRNGDTSLSRRGPYISLVEAYETIRKRNRSLLSRMSYTVFFKITEEARKTGSVDTLDSLAADLLEIFKGDAQDRVKIARTLLASANPPLLRPDRTLSLLCLVDTIGSLSSIRPYIIAWIANSLAEASSSNNLDDTLLDNFVPLLNRYLHEFSAPTGPKSMVHLPPNIVEASFSLLRRFLALGKEQCALSLFQVLVDTNNIPAEALYQVDNDSADFAFIIGSTLVRSCLHWGWRRRAVALLMDILHVESKPDASTISLTVDTMYALLETPYADDLADCCSLICTVDTRAADYVIPYGLIRLFYSSAKLLDDGAQAERLFAHTQRKSTLEKACYPPPQGQAISWMLEYLTLTSRNMHLGRVLVKLVTEGNVPIPLQHRTRVISTAAANGFSVYSRALWERYSLGVDRKMVMGNAKTMLRMVSLFGDLIRKEATRQQKSQPSEEEDAQEPSVEPDPSNDLTHFANYVLTEFRQAKEPIETASHFDLNALARAYFILGQVTSGFVVFKILLNRKEIPDVHDINVALSAVAAQDPHQAADLIERMVERGLEPDAITFGTVLHQAIVHRDKELVHTLTSRARALGLQQLSLKTISAVIRASVTVQDDDCELDSRVELRPNLLHALDVVKSLTGASFVCTPNTGKYCISTALRIGDPVIAFRFWKLLVKDKAEWGDIEQSQQRRLIAQMIAEHRRKGWLDADRGMAMLSQLGGEGASEMRR